MVLIPYLFLMKPIKPPQKIEIKESHGKGHGVFATEDIQKGETVEICKVLVVDYKNKLLKDYVWMDTRIAKQVIALGYGSLYNHTPKPNIERIFHEDVFFKFVAIRDIKKGEEILVNYGHGYWENRNEPLS